MKDRPTIEQCKVCSDNYKKQIQNLRDGIDDLHYAINRMMKEYAKLHMEELALLEIEALCKKDIPDTLNMIKKICKNIENQKKEIEGK